MSVDAASAVQYLLQSQNADGGWNYRPLGSSWTEPTCLALIALRAWPGGHSRRGFEWLLSQRRSDGGWGPKAGVPASTWVTALGLLALHLGGRMNGDDPGVRWLLEAAGAESSLVARLRAFLLSPGRGSEDRSDRGWPWYPGAAAWVAPTAFTLVALDRIQPALSHTGLALRKNEGKMFLLGRRCADGGWNHGSSRALGYDGPSYPETTGMALLALAGENRAAASVPRAIAHAKVCRSLEAWSWLQMGMWAHKAGASHRPPQARIYDIREASLYLLAEAATAGRDPFGSN